MEQQNTIHILRTIPVRDYSVVGGWPLVTIAHREGVGFPEENAYFIPNHSRKFLILRLEKRPLYEEGQCVWSKGLFPFIGARRI